MDVSQDKTAALAAHLATISRKVFAPNYLGALAERHGIVPRNEKQAAIFLRVGERLLEADYAAGSKQAEADTAFFERAADRLEEILGGGPAGVGAVEASRVKRAAAHYLQDPEVAAAVAALHEAAIAG